MNVKRMLIIMLSMLSLNAFAVERQYWLIGPSFSSHASTEKAPVVASGSNWAPCSWIPLSSGGSQANRPDCRSPIPITNGFSQEPQLYYPQTAPKKKWNENNRGLGFEITDVYDNYKEKYIIDYHRDSLYNPALYAGIAKQYRVLKDFDILGTSKTLGKLNVDIGLAAGLWWRSYSKKNKDFDYSFDSRRYIDKKAVIPVIFPVATIELGKVGFNVMYSPKISYKGKDIVPTNIIMYQVLVKIPY